MSATFQQPEATELSWNDRLRLIQAEDILLDTDVCWWNDELACYCVGHPSNAVPVETKLQRMRAFAVRRNAKGGVS